MSELLSGIPESYALLIMLVLASMNFSLSGYRKKFIASLQGEPVAMDWAKFRNTALMGLGIAGVAWVGVELGVAGLEGVSFDTHADFAVNFLAATGAIYLVHSWATGDFMGRKGKKPPKPSYPDTLVDKNGSVIPT